MRLFSIYIGKINFSNARAGGLFVGYISMLFGLLFVIGNLLERKDRKDVFYASIFTIFTFTSIGCICAVHTNTWNWIVPHQFSLLVTCVIFLFDLIQLPIVALVPAQSEFVRFTCDWFEFDASKKENVLKFVVKECIISAVFLGLCGYAIYLLHSVNVYLER